MKPEKPLGGKAYGSIPHLPGSKFGNRDDKGIDEKAARFFLQGAGKNDRIVVLEKLDGSCVSVANINGEIVPLIRSGYRASTSNYFQHWLFAQFIGMNTDLFEGLAPGERICGEWLAQAHGTRYDLDGRCPFVPFDIFVENTRQNYDVLTRYCNHHDLEYAPVLFYEVGRGCGIKEALQELGEFGHYGAIDSAEGCVWRWERTDGNPIMMAKYVRPESEPGRYLESMTGKDPIWNWSVPK